MFTLSLIHISFKNTILAMMDELVVKQAEKFKEDVKEENVKQIRKIEDVYKRQVVSYTFIFSLLSAFYCFLNNESLLLVD